MAHSSPGQRAFNAIVFALAVLLASTRSVRLHSFGAALAWVLTLTAIVLAAFGLIT